VMQALIAHGVIGDFRAPDIIRFGLTPLYIGFTDVWDAARILERVLTERLWDRADFKKKAQVT
jgi:kynureninase